jgi:hypothetical protein
MAEAAFALAAGPRGGVAADFLKLGRNHARTAEQLEQTLETDALGVLEGNPSLAQADEILAPLRVGVILALWALGGNAVRKKIEEWRDAIQRVVLCITGDDLLAAGIPPGPAVRVGLAAARRAALDGSAVGVEAQKNVALEAAQQALGEPRAKEL